MTIQIQQKYVTLAFVYWDNRQFIDLLDPIMFGDFWPLVSLIKQHSNMSDIWKEWLDAGLMDEMIECDLDVAMHYRINAGRELLRLWENWIDTQFKKASKKLDHDAVKRINSLYEKLKERLEGQEENTILEESKQYITMARERKWVKTGLPFLDKDIGWLRAGTITRVSGYSNVGKSRFMYRVMVNILKQGKSVHLMSLEVPKGVVLINLVSAYYSVNTGDVEYGKHDDKLNEFYEQFKDKCLVEDDKTSLEQIEASVDFNDKDVIFIDYIQNIRVDWKDEYTKMTRIAQELQKMAITTKKPFFDLSQVSNDWAKYKVGDMIPSKGSGAFVHACEIGLVLYRGDEGSNQLKLAIAKNKFWAKDIEIILNADLGKCEFTFSNDNTFWVWQPTPTQPSLSNEKSIPRSTWHD